MAEIVNSLFGVSPEMLQQARAQQDYARNLQAVKLTPMQQGNLMLRQGASELGNVGMGLLGVEDPEMQKVTAIKQLSSQFDLASPQGMRQFAGALQQIAPNEAMMAAKRADEMEQSGLTRKKTTADIELQERKVSQDEKLREALSKLPENATDAQYLQVFRQFGSPDQQAKAIEASIARKAKAAGEGDGIGKLTPAQKAVDTKFGKEYNDFVSAGGSSAIAKNLKMLDDAIKIIKDSPEGDVSGKIVGLSDKTGTLSYTHPKAAEAKDLIGGVAQSNLRAILGGQFAAKEGEQLLARAYNTAQPKKDNLNRLTALREQIEKAAQDKIDASQYYEEKGTLKGFKGKYSVTQDLPTPDVNDPLGLRKNK